MSGDTAGTTGDSKAERDGNAGTVDMGLVWGFRETASQPPPPLPVGTKSCRGERALQLEVGGGMSHVEGRGRCRGPEVGI